MSSPCFPRRCHFAQILLYWGGSGGSVVGAGTAGATTLEEGPTALWNPFGASAGGVGLRAGRADDAGMLEAALVVCKPYPGPGTDPLGGWPPEASSPAGAFVYVPDSPTEPLRPRPWTVTTDIAQEVLLDNDTMRVWRFELDGGASCHAHQHVFPYFFLNLLPARTRRLEWAGGETPPPGGLTPRCPPNEADPMMLFWLDTLDGGARSTHFHGLENHQAESRFRQFIVEFKEGVAPELRPQPSTTRDPTLAYLPGLVVLHHLETVTVFEKFDLRPGGGLYVARARRQVVVGHVGHH